MGRKWLSMRLSVDESGDRSNTTSMYPSSVGGYSENWMQLSDVAEGLAYLHDQHVVHGDVKGLNILISRDVRAMLCDFGLAKDMDRTLSTSHDSIGTFPWMSPERLQGGGPGRSYQDDVYAFGMTIFEVRVMHFVSKSDTICYSRRPSVVKDLSLVIQATARSSSPCVVKTKGPIRTQRLQ